jgi:hypothetical protein
MVDTLCVKMGGESGHFMRRRWTLYAWITLLNHRLSTGIVGTLCSYERGVN